MRLRNIYFHTNTGVLEIDPLWNMRMRQHSKLATWSYNVLGVFITLHYGFIRNLFFFARYM